MSYEAGGLSVSQKKEEVITFKADRALAERMKGIANRSEFIRAAVLAALENTCPLCGGTGVLSASQMDYWKKFSRTHHLEQCPDTHEVLLVCDAHPAAKE